jgi:hypothetical protein
MADRAKKSLAGWFWIGAVVIALLLLAIGREVYSDTVAFKWIWRLVWFIGVPVLLFASYRTAVRGRSQSSDDTGDPKGPG